MDSFNTEAENLNSMKAKIVDIVNGLQGNKTSVQKELEDVRSRMKEEPCSLYLSEFSRRQDRREKLAQAVEVIADKVGIETSCCDCDAQCDGGVSRCGDCGGEF